MNETKKDSEKVISDETQQNIRILGINISHDASIAATQADPGGWQRSRVKSASLAATRAATHRS